MSRVAVRQWVAGLLLLCAPMVARAEGSEPAHPDSSAAPRRPPSRLYYGGSLGMSFYGSYRRLDVSVLVGYRLSPKVSLGSRLVYEYLSDRRTEPPLVTNSYGGSVLSRYLVSKRLFAQAEIELRSFDLAEGRELVPFLLVGGGYLQPLSPNVYFTFDVEVDLLQDPRSPYDDLEPRTHIGILLMP